MACCKTTSVIGHKTIQTINDRLKRVHDIFPGGRVSVCVINSKGQMIIGSRGNHMQDDELLTVVTSMKRSALVFAATVGQNECPVMHIKGTSHIFSCYDVGENVLAFFTEMNPLSVEVFDTTDADAKMAPIVEELKILLASS